MWKIRHKMTIFYCKDVKKKCAVKIIFNYINYLILSLFSFFFFFLFLFCMAAQCSRTKNSQFRPPNIQYEAGLFWGTRGFIQSSFRFQLSHIGFEGVDHFVTDSKKNQESRLEPLQTWYHAELSKRVRWNIMQQGKMHMVWSLFNACSVYMSCTNASLLYLGGSS